MYPIIIFPKRSFKSSISSERHSIAIISDATVIKKPSSLGMPFVFPPSPTTMFLRALSFISIALFHIICVGSMPRLFPWCMWLSIAADNKLFAAVNACISPVKWRLMSSIGTTWEYPPPAAPPLIPITGPKEGSLKAIIALCPILLIAWPIPIVVVVFPSPAGVGFIAVTRISLPSWFLQTLSHKSNDNLALYFP